jgi:hypothetical protein
VSYACHALRLAKTVYPLRSALVAQLFRKEAEDFSPHPANNKGSPPGQEASGDSTNEHVLA